jgi:hypothetical protein
VAGFFYPADPARLAREIDAFLGAAPAIPLAGPPLALVVPHAGIMYSGGVAALAFRQLQAGAIERVFLLGPSHRLTFPGIAAWDGSAFRTPLGDVPVDRGAIAELAARGAEVVRVRPAAHEEEHALEVELPFLSRRLGAFRLVPLLMGRQDAESAHQVGRLLAEVLVPGAGDLLVASSDLSHYHRYEEAVELDRQALERVAELDAEGFLQGLAEQRFEACGGGPIGAGLIAGHLLGARTAQVLGYQNSGDVTGDRERVVGYAACALS